MTKAVNTFCKAERLCSKNTIEQLFSGKAKSFSSFPLRVVFMPTEKREEASASILISVPKKKFKRAVKRNRVKRQIRESYRKNKHDLLSLLSEKEHGLAIAFIFLDNELHTSVEIEEKMKGLLTRIIDRQE